MSRSAPRRIRSLSLSIDFRCTRSNETLEPYFEQKLDHLTPKSLRFNERNRNFSENCIEHCDVVFSEEFAQNGICLYDRFPFAYLPVDCKLRVFSFLSAEERARGSLVCWEWQRLLKNACLWETVDLTSLTFCCSISQLHRECTLLCYNAYRRRLTMFLQFLLKIKPSIRGLRFALDIGDSEDGWNDLLHQLLQLCRFKDLMSADINWTETPQKKPFILRSTSVTWSNSDYRELTFRRRIRQRYFINFFDLFTACAPNVVSLCVPFDWSERSLRALERLHKLKVLVLKRYFSYAPVDPETLFQFFHSASNLERLTLEIWTESYGGFHLYRLHSASIQYLDISACRGVYLEEMVLPNLKVFRVSRCPRNLQNFFLQQQEDELPCMYEILVHGTQHLQYLNDHQMQPNWHEGVYEELENVLMIVCSCRFHKSIV